MQAEHKSAPDGSKQGRETFNLSHARFSANLPAVSTSFGRRAPTKTQAEEQKFERRGVTTYKDEQGQDTQHGRAVRIHYGLGEAKSKTNKASAHWKEDLFVKKPRKFAEVPIYDDLRRQTGDTSKGFFTKDKYTKFGVDLGVPELTHHKPCSLESCNPFFLSGAKAISM